MGVKHGISHYGTNRRLKKTA